MFYPTVYMYIVNKMQRFENAEKRPFKTEAVYMVSSI